jgi:hypothetical protein
MLTGILPDLGDQRQKASLKPAAIDGRPVSGRPRPARLFGRAGRRPPWRGESVYEPHPAVLSGFTGQQLKGGDARSGSILCAPAPVTTPAM